MKDLTPTNRVRVSLPASVAADIGSLKKAIGSVLDHLGCQACCSGHDIIFELQRDFVIRKDLRASLEPGVAIRKSALARGLQGEKVAHIGLNPDAATKIENVYSAIDKLAEMTGHTACATGCDIFFGLERMLVIPAIDRFEIQEVVATFG